MNERQECPEDITPLLHDASGSLALYVAAWPRLPRDAKGNPDHEAAAEILGIPAPLAQRLHRRASALGLVYPDGTIHSLARGFLRARVADALNAKPPKGRK